MIRGRRRVPVVLGLAVLTVIAAACQPPKSPAKPPIGSLGPANFVTGLDHPWDMAFLPDGTMFFTERPGPVSVRLPNGTVRGLGNPPGSAPSGEGGVMGIAVDPSFASNRSIYVCYTHSADNRVARFTVNAQFTSMSFAANVVTGMNKGGIHNGCRTRFGPDGMLWITMGDAGNASLARNLNSLNGKVLRVTPTGAAAPGNPGGSRFITFGHRNPQGIAFRANGEVYTAEHGPNTDDEVNLLQPGGDYGWNGSDMTCCGGIPAVWSSGSPTIAPSGATFLYGAHWQDWNGALVLAVLKAQRLQIFVERNGVLDFANPTIIETDVRLRSAVLGPDGALYVATDVDAPGGAIWRITPS